MATLHFDTDAGRQTSSQISTAVNALQTELNNLQNRVNSMVGSEWMGNSANQFQSSFGEWANQLRTTIEQLSTLRERLEREINEWEQAANALN